MQHFHYKKKKEPKSKKHQTEGPNLKPILTANNPYLLLVWFHPTPQIGSLTLFFHIKTKCAVHFR